MAEWRTFRDDNSPVVSCWDAAMPGDIRAAAAI